MSGIIIKGHLLGYHFKNMDPDEPLYWAFSTSHNVKLDEQMIAAIPHEITAEVPEINVVAAQVAGLEAAKLKALDDYHRTVRELNERLSKLQAISMDRESA